MIVCLVGNRKPKSHPICFLAHLFPQNFQKPGMEITLRDGEHTLRSQLWFIVWTEYLVLDGIQLECSTSNLHHAFISSVIAIVYIKNQQPYVGLSSQL